MFFFIFGKLCCQDRRVLPIFRATVARFEVINRIVAFIQRLLVLYRLVGCCSRYLHLWLEIRIAIDAGLLFLEMIALWFEILLTRVYFYFFTQGRGGRLGNRAHTKGDVETDIMRALTIEYHVLNVLQSYTLFLRTRKLLLLLRLVLYTFCAFYRLLCTFEIGELAICGHLDM